jgi:hypothetical protein
MNDVSIVYNPPEAVYVVELWSVLDGDSNVFLLKSRRTILDILRIQSNYFSGFFFFAIMVAILNKSGFEADAFRIQYYSSLRSKLLAFTLLTTRIILSPFIYDNHFT